MNRASSLIVLIGITATAIAQPATQPNKGVGVASSKFSPVADKTGNAALFIGINDFSKDKNLAPLRFAVNDAIATAHLFAIELKLVQPKNSVLALSGDPVGEEAKTQLAALKTAGVRLTSAAKSDIFVELQQVVAAPTADSDILILCVSSHGFEESGIPYVMPADGVKAFLSDTAINLTSIEVALGRSKAGKRLLILDACRDKPLAGGRGGDAAMARSFHEALARSAGQAVLASCDVGQVSFENEQVGHGVFTHYLLRALRGEAATDEQGLIRIDHVIGYVAREVEIWSKGHGPQLQQPWFKGPQAARDIPLAMDAVKAAARAEASRRLSELTKSRLEALRSYLVKKQISADQCALGKRLFEADSATFDKYKREVHAAYLDLLSGKLPPDQLSAVLGSIQKSNGEPDGLLLSAMSPSQPVWWAAEALRLAKKSACNGAPYPGLAEDRARCGDLREASRLFELAANCSEQLRPQREITGAIWMPDWYRGQMIAYYCDSGDYSAAMRVLNTLKYDERKSVWALDIIKRRVRDEHFHDAPNAAATINDPEIRARCLRDIYYQITNSKDRDQCFEAYLSSVSAASSSKHWLLHQFRVDEYERIREDSVQNQAIPAHLKRVLREEIRLLPNLVIDCPETRRDDRNSISPDSFLQLIERLIMDLIKIGEQSDAAEVAHLSLKRLMAYYRTELTHKDTEDRRHVPIEHIVRAWIRIQSLTETQLDWPFGEVIHGRDFAGGIEDGIKRIAEDAIELREDKVRVRRMLSRAEAASDVVPKWDHTMNYAYASLVNTFGEGAENVKEFRLKLQCPTVECRIEIARGYVTCGMRVEARQCLKKIDEGVADQCAREGERLFLAWLAVGNKDKAAQYEPTRDQMSGALDKLAGWIPPLIIAGQETEVLRLVKLADENDRTECLGALVEAYVQIGEIEKARLASVDLKDGDSFQVLIDEMTKRGDWEGAIRFVATIKDESNRKESTEEIEHAMREHAVKVADATGLSELDSEFQKIACIGLRCAFLEGVLDSKLAGSDKTLKSWVVNKAAPMLDAIENRAERLVFSRIMAAAASTCGEIKPLGMFGSQIVACADTAGDIDRVIGARLDGAKYLVEVDVDRAEKIAAEQAIALWSVEKPDKMYELLGKLGEAWGSLIKKGKVINELHDYYLNQIMKRDIPVAAAAHFCSKVALGMEGRRLN